MDEASPKAVLPYQPSGPGRPHWLWFALGIVTGVAAVASVAAIALFAGRLRAGARAVPVATAVAVAAPVPPPVSLTAAQDAGRLVTSRDSIGIPYGKFIFLASGRDVVALRITCPTGLARAVTYEWLHSADGAAADFGAPGVRRGGGSVVEKGVSAQLDAGPFRTSWSQGSTKGGWLYWPRGADPAVAVAASTADDPRGFARVLATTEWRDEQGTTVDPRHR